ETRIGGEFRAGPFPNVAEHLDCAATRRRIRVGPGGSAAEGELVEVGALAVRATRGGLPFAFGREALTGPAREGVRLVPGDVDHRQLRVDRLGPAHRASDPTVLAVTVPVHRRVPLVLLHEADVGAVRHWSAIDPERLELDAVPGPLVVIRETN